MFQFRSFSHNSSQSGCCDVIPVANTWKEEEEEKEERWMGSAIALAKKWIMRLCGWKRLPLGGKWNSGRIRCNIVQVKSQQCENKHAIAQIYSKPAKTKNKWAVYHLKDKSKGKSTEWRPTTWQHWCYFSIMLSNHITSTLESQPTSEQTGYW